jgi:predicted DNA-binding transcriptional regulator YafY
MKLVPLKDWAKEEGISYDVAYDRYRKGKIEGYKDRYGGLFIVANETKIDSEEWKWRMFIHDEMNMYLKDSKGFKEKVSDERYRYIKTLYRLSHLPFETDDGYIIVHGIAALSKDVLAGSREEIQDQLNKIVNRMRNKSNY